MSATCCIACPDCHDDFLQLTERELEICEAVCTSSVPVGFSTVRRAVGYHQEVVSRTLRRLLTYGAIEKTDGKYRCKVSQ